LSYTSNNNKKKKKNKTNTSEPCIHANDKPLEASLFSALSSIFSRNRRGNRPGVITVTTDISVAIGTIALASSSGDTPAQSFAILVFVFPRLYGVSTEIPMEYIAPNAIVRTVEVSEVITHNGIVVQKTTNIAVTAFNYAVQSPLFSDLLTYLNKNVIFVCC
jgi:hypothetical protein